VRAGTALCTIDPRQQHRKLGSTDRRYSTMCYFASRKKNTCGPATSGVTIQPVLITRTSSPDEIEGKRSLPAAKVPELRMIDHKVVTCCRVSYGSLPARVHCGQTALHRRLPVFAIQWLVIGMRIRGGKRCCGDRRGTREAGGKSGVANGKKNAEEVEGLGRRVGRWHTRHGRHTGLTISNNTEQSSSIRTLRQFRRPACR